MLDENRASRSRQPPYPIDYESNISTVEKRKIDKSRVPSNFTVGMVADGGYLQHAAERSNRRVLLHLLHDDSIALRRAEDIRRLLPCQQ